MLIKHKTCRRSKDVSIDTTHFKLTYRRHGWNWSQNASDRKGLLSFGCSLEQLELLEMLESHIERLERAREPARDLAALSKDRRLPPKSTSCKGFSVLDRGCWQLLSGSASLATAGAPSLKPLACPNWASKPTRGDFKSRPTRLAWRANSARAF